MKFALIYQVQLPKPWTDVSEYQLFQNILAQVSFAEEMGFEGVWFMEHHFAPEQSHSSAPDMILAASEPAHFEDAAGACRGAHAGASSAAHGGARGDVGPAERRTRGVRGRPFRDIPSSSLPSASSLDDSRGMWEESLAILPKAWTEEIFSASGEILPDPFA